MLEHKFENDPITTINNINLVRLYEEDHLSMVQISQ